MTDLEIFETAQRVARIAREGTNAEKLALTDEEVACCYVVWEFTPDGKMRVVRKPLTDDV